MKSARVGAEENKRIVELLKMWRENVGLTQQEVAFRLKKPQSFVAKYESGKRSLDVAEFFLLLKALRLAPDAALNRIYDTNPSFGTVGPRRRQRPR